MIYPLVLSSLIYGFQYTDCVFYFIILSPSLQREGLKLRTKFASASEIEVGKHIDT